MPDREKVIKAIEICNSEKHNCTECELFYVEDCNDKLMRDVLELLKEQESERVEIVDSDCGRTHWYVCGGCKTPINQGDRFCHECGRKMKWE